MLKRVEKDFDNVYGIGVVDNPFSESRPVILAMLPMVYNLKEINGYFSRLLEMMQVRSMNTDSSYTIRDMPFDMITGEYREAVDEKIIVNIPLHDVEFAKRYLRNLNIFSYCAGNYKTAKLMHKIHDYLVQSGYQADEINEIMKEIFVLQIVDNHYEGDYISPIPYATTVVVQDVYDLENSEHVLDFNADNPFISTMQFHGVRYMLYSSFGERSLFEEEREHYFKSDYADAPIVNMVIALYLIKAINLSLSDSSKKNISIYSELEKMIKLAKEYIMRLGKKPQDLSQEEKKELNKMLYAEVKKIFIDDIPVKQLSDDEKEYLTKKDKAITSIQNLNRESVFTKYKEFMHLVREMIKIYNNHEYGEVLHQKYDNSGISHGVTREEELNQRFSLLEEEFNDIHALIDNMKYPQDISSVFRAEFVAKLEGILSKIKEVINSTEFQKILNDVVTRETVFHGK